MQNLPLWMVEGLAEYMSLGRIDPFTAMWMQDAVMNNNVPNFIQLQNPTYFPYRYGQAFWSVLTGLVVTISSSPCWSNTAIYGLQNASVLTLGLTIDQLSTRFQNSIRTYYEPFLGEKGTFYWQKKLVSSKLNGV